MQSVFVRDLGILGQLELDSQTRPVRRSADTFFNILDADTPPISNIALKTSLY